MIDKKEIIQRAEFVALETLVIAMSARYFQLSGAMSGGSSSRLEAEQAALRRQCEAMTIPGVDPALSDLYASEFHHALDALLERVAQRLKDSA